MKRDLLPTPKVEIGSRWHPGVIYRCDTEKGAFEVVNSTIVDSVVEEFTQRALLLPLSERQRRRIEEIRRLRSLKR